MKTQFHIDSYQGVSIFINVENGIITHFTGSGKMPEKLNERFNGKGIADFKRDFESTMKPAWYCVKSDSWCNAKQVLHALETKERFFINQKFHNARNLTIEQLANIEKLLDVAMKDIYEAKTILKAEIKNLLDIHNFDITEFVPK